MNKELIGIILTYGITLVLALPLGRAIATWLRGERSLWNIMAPLEGLVYRICGINPVTEMNWKQHLKALLVVNAVWFVYAFVLLLAQGSLFLNPDGNPSQSPDLALNTVISFLVNCNLQHYSGESGLTYPTQVCVIAFLQFVSAATGIAAVFILFKALRDKVTDQLGNFWVFFTQAITRILLPLCLLVAAILAFNGTPSSWEGKGRVVSLQGDTVQVSRGPAAGMIAIKHLGTNGGGFCS